METTIIFSSIGGMLLFAAIMYFVIKWAVTRALLDCGIARGDAQDEARYVALFVSTLGLINRTEGNPWNLTNEAAKHLSELKKESYEIVSSVEDSAVDKIRKLEKIKEAVEKIDVSSQPTV